MCFCKNNITNIVKLYKITHKNHPVTIWMRTSLANYLWTLDMVDAMQTVHERQSWYEGPQKAIQLVIENNG